MPPSFIWPLGGWVRNSQLIAGAPRTTIVTSRNSAAATMKAAAAAVILTATV
jgi:hypothetical protein